MTSKLEPEQYFNPHEIYHANTSLVNNLKQEESPEQSDHGSEEYDDEEYGTNDKFLEELERENQMLERELESLVQLKNQSTQQTSNPTSSDLYQSGDQKNLHRIVEQTEEDHESYCYSNSEDDYTAKKRKKKNPLMGTQEIDVGSAFASPEIKIEEIAIAHQNRIGRNLKYSPKQEQSAEEEDSLSPEKTTTTKTSVTSRDTNRLTDKENQAQQANNTSYRLKQASQSSLGPRSSSKKGKNSPPKYEKMDKVQSLEYRLSGANKAIKALEREVKMKDEKIQELLREIDKKNKFIEMQQANGVNVSQGAKVNQVKESLTTVMRKKEKQLEKKVKEQDVIINENKKYMTRLQELNAKILSKIKEVEEENAFLKKREDPTEKMTALEDENKKLREKLKDLNEEREHSQDMTEEIHRKNEKIVKMYRDVEEKSEKFIMKNKSLNDLLLTLITTYHNRDKLGSS